MKNLLLCVGLVAAFFAFTAHAENGGPSSGGYVYSRVSSPQTFQAIAGTQGAVRVYGVNSVGFVDDAETSAQLGFSFPFFDSNYSTVHVSTNGLICLGNAGSSGFANVDLTTSTVSTNLPAIAVYWDDLYIHSNQPGGLWVKQRSVAGVKEFVVEWDRVGFNGLAADQTITVQAILREDGSITCHYPDVDVNSAGITRGGSATLGIRAVNGQTDGTRLQPCFNTTNYLTSGDRIDYYRLPDSRALAFDFTGRTTSASFVTSQATADGVEDPNVSGGTEGRSVWFRWVAPTDGLLSFATEGSSFDTVMAVLDASQGIGNTTSLAFDDGGGGDGTSRVDSLQCTPGQVFLIMVAGKDKGSGVTSGSAKVTASFTALERVHFLYNNVSIGEGRTVSIPLVRAHANPTSLDVDIRITDPDGNVVSTETVSATGDNDLSNLAFTVPEDTTFGINRSYLFEILSKPGSYVAITPGFMDLFVIDNDPVQITPRTFIAALPAQTANPQGTCLVTCTITATGGFSGKLTQGGNSFSFKGQLDGGANGQAIIQRKGFGQIVVKLNLFGDGSFIGIRVEGPDFRGSFAPIAAVAYSAKNKVPVGVAGRYTLVSPDTTPGFYYGAGTVSPAGLVKFAGVLADGTPFSFGSALGAANSFSAYAKTHGGKGFLRVSSTLGSLGEGAAFRPAGIVDKKTSAFQSGYYENFDVRVAFYPPLAPTAQPSAGFTATAGKGGFGLGTLGALTDFAPFTLALNGKATSSTAGFTLKLDRKTGFFRGTRPNPTTGGKPIPFAGIFVPGEDSGTGAGTGYLNSHDATTGHNGYFLPKP